MDEICRCGFTYFTDRGLLESDPMPRYTGRVPASVHAPAPFPLQLARCFCRKGTGYQTGLWATPPVSQSRHPDLVRSGFLIPNTATTLPLWKYHHSRVAVLLTSEKHQNPRFSVASAPRNAIFSQCLITNPKTAILSGASLSNPKNALLSSQQGRVNPSSWEIPTRQLWGELPYGISGFAVLLTLGQKTASGTQNITTPFLGVFFFPAPRKGL